MFNVKVQITWELYVIKIKINIITTYLFRMNSTELLCVIDRVCKRLEKLDHDTLFIILYVYIYKHNTNNTKVFIISIHPIYCKSNFLTVKITSNYQYSMVKIDQIFFIKTLGKWSAVENPLNHVYHDHRLIIVVIQNIENQYS